MDTRTNRFPIVLMALAAAVPLLSAAAPQPALVSNTWELKFTYSKPEPIAVNKLDGTIKWYWFMTYKVTNHTDTDRQFLPKFTIATDEADVIQANRNIPTRVFKAIKQRLQNSLLEFPVEVTGTLKPGEDQARESMLVWPAFDRDVDFLDVFVTGLSGETTKVLNPKTDKPLIDPQSLKPVINPRTGKALIDPQTNRPKVNPRPLLLRKTLMLEYQLPGSTLHPQHLAVLFKKKLWVMR